MKNTNYHFKYNAKNIKWQQKTPKKAIFFVFFLD